VNEAQVTYLLDSFQQAVEEAARALRRPESSQRLARICDERDQRREDLRGFMLRLKARDESLGTALEGVQLEISEERVRQDRQWGGPAADDERDAAHWSRLRTKFEMRLIAAARGALISEDDIDVERDSLIKLAALCVAQVESRDRIERRVERLVEETEDER
jgi:hypothetical protein